MCSMGHDSVNYNEQRKHQKSLHSIGQTRIIENPCDIIILNHIKRKQGCMNLFQPLERTNRNHKAGASHPLVVCHSGHKYSLAVEQKAQDELVP